MSASPDQSNPPTALFAWPGGTAIYILPSPSPSQLALFRAANIDLPRQSHCIPDVDLMRRAGATFYPDMNICPEAVALFRSRKTPEGPQEPGQSEHSSKFGSLLSWPSSGGVWVLSNPSAAQWDFVESEGRKTEGGDGGEDEHAKTLERAGATFFADPADNEVAREALLVRVAK